MRKGSHFTEEQLEHLRAARKDQWKMRAHPLTGTHPSPETRAKISIALSGENHPNYGKTSGMRGRKQTPEANAKIAAARIGKKASKETLAKMAEAQRGKHMSLEARRKIAAAQLGKKRGPFSDEHKAKISASLKGENNPHYGKHPSPETLEKISGENASNWRGGISFEPYCPKFNKRFKVRVRAFFEDKCVLCCKTAEENKTSLSVHHVEYDKSACCDGNPAIFAALCCCCHSKTSNGDRMRWENMLRRIIDEIYEGRSYYTKEEWKTIKRAETINQRIYGAKA